jgi:hypothetical protein
VLPYGQMSLWGATVITNLLSAIPWLGKDFVELLIIIFIILFSLLNNSVFNKENLFHNLQVYLIKKRLETTNIEEIIRIPPKVLATFIGLLDGDGTITIREKNNKYIEITCNLELDKRDLELINYFKNVFKIGRIAKVKIKSKYDYTIRYTLTRKDLEFVLIPLMIYHNIYFLNQQRRMQYNKCLYIITNNITLFKNISLNIPDSIYLNKLPDTFEEYLNIPFFNNWLIGFTMAEGSFFTNNKLEFVFAIKHRTDLLLFQAISAIFQSKRKLTIIEKKGNHNERILFSVSSRKSIQLVVHFFSFSNLHPLIGYKNNQYRDWISRMKKSSRYNKLKLP